MRKDPPTGTELDLLKVEMQILASKVANVIDTLWKIRTASITLWTAVLGVGLGSFTDNKEPVLPLLILSCLLPVLFFNIDARNNRWYRRLSSREYSLQQYLNDPDYKSPEGFPIYDLSGANTFRGSSYYAWEFSIARSCVDPIPLSVYGGQALFSVVACLFYVSPAHRLLVLCGVVALALCFAIWVLLARARILGRRPNDA